ncbi:hypothetical protein EV361DRAFT_876007 [Lentinula raphanica]|nr:hypothetical protein F5880DRAFT_34472 [Lentinula raphanica]KAJ3978077.1 hypothetical protein EV361DRAFT_876007 [Lentinula raphanica]
MRFNSQPLLVFVGSMMIAVGALPLIARNLQGEKWILQEYEKTVTAADKHVFSRFTSFVYNCTQCSGNNLPTISPEAKLKDVDIGPLLSTEGLHNKGVYSIKGKYKNHEGDSIVLKVLKTVDDEAYAEVKALKGVDEYVDSGMFEVKGKEEPVIIMLKVPGSVLIDTDEYKKSHTDDKEKMKEEAIDLMCNEVARVGKSSGILHNDNRIENIHVTMSGKKVIAAKLTDWGAYELYTMDKGASTAEIIAFCKKHWTPVDWFVQADFE